MTVIGMCRRTTPMHTDNGADTCRLPPVPIRTTTSGFGRSKHLFKKLLHIRNAIMQLSTTSGNWRRERLWWLLCILEQDKRANPSRYQRINALGGDGGIDRDELVKAKCARNVSPPRCEAVTGHGEGDIEICTDRAFVDPVGWCHLHRRDYHFGRAIGCDGCAVCAGLVESP